MELAFTRIWAQSVALLLCQRGRSSIAGEVCVLAHLPSRTHLVRHPPAPFPLWTEAPLPVLGRLEVPGVQCSQEQPANDDRGELVHKWSI